MSTRALISGAEWRRSGLSPAGGGCAHCGGEAPRLEQSGAEQRAARNALGGSTAIHSDWKGAGEGAGVCGGGGGLTSPTREMEGRDHTTTPA